MIHALQLAVVIVWVYVNTGLTLLVLKGDEIQGFQNRLKAYLFWPFWKWS